MRALLLLLLGACAGRQAGRGEVAEPPVWDTPEGRDSARMQLIGTMISTNRPDEALSLVAQMRAEGISGAQIDVLHARALRDVGLVDDAQTLLVAVVKRHPRDADAHNQLGILYVDRRDIGAALPHLERAVRLDPRSADYQNNLGFALMAAGRPKEAVAPLRRSLAIDSTREQTRNNLGFALMGAGLDDEAWRVFRATRSEAEARYHFGYAYEMRGDPLAARRQYEAAIKADARFTAAVRALARLTTPNPPVELHP